MNRTTRSTSTTNETNDLKFKLINPSDRGVFNYVLEFDGRLELNYLHGIGVGVVVEHAVREVACLIGELKVNTCWIDYFAIGRVDGFKELQRPKSLRHIQSDRTSSVPVTNLVVSVLELYCFF